MLRLEIAQDVDWGGVARGAAALVLFRVSGPELSDNDEKFQTPAAFRIKRMTGLTA